MISSVSPPYSGVTPDPKMYNENNSKREDQEFKIHLFPETENPECPGTAKVTDRLPSPNMTNPKVPE